METRVCAHGSKAGNYQLGILAIAFVVPQPQMASSTRRNLIVL